MTPKLAGTAVLVTGASSGIGAATALLGARTVPVAVTWAFRQLARIR